MSGLSFWIDLLDSIPLWMVSGDNSSTILCGCTYISWDSVLRPGKVANDDDINGPLCSNIHRKKCTWNQTGQQRLLCHYAFGILKCTWISIISSWLKRQSYALLCQVILMGTFVKLKLTILCWSRSIYLIKSQLQGLEMGSVCPFLAPSWISSIVTTRAVTAVLF